MGLKGRPAQPYSDLNSLLRHRQQIARLLSGSGGKQAASVAGRRRPAWLVVLLCLPRKDGLSGPPGGPEAAGTVEGAPGTGQRWAAAFLGRGMPTWTCTLEETQRLLLWARRPTDPEGVGDPGILNGG